MPKKNYHHGDLKNSLVSAAITILAKEGVAGMTLRKVARKAGVSHAAPYAHFSDKQALIAAISTEGFRRIYSAMDNAIACYPDDPLDQLVAAAWAYVQFGFNDPDHFKVTFSSVLEKEKDYPAFVEISQQTFSRVVGIVAACQRTGILRDGPPEVLAVGIWAQLHGLVSLLIEGQISHTILDEHSPREIFVKTLSQFLLVPVPESILS
ncbi:MAG: TetR/AcrR family transcriptional regulator [Chloroflexota bacterium]